MIQIQTLPKKDTRPWWAQWREAYFQLSTLATAAPWDAPKGPRIYSDGDFSFDDKEIGDQFDFMEEALWAHRNGLS